MLAPLIASLADLNPEPIASFVDVIAEPATLPAPPAISPATFAAVPKIDVIAFKISVSKSSSESAQVIAPCNLPDFLAEYPAMYPPARKEIISVIAVQIPVPTPTPSNG